MPRNKRINLPGCIYHVIVRGIERKPIFKEEADKEEIIKRLTEGLKVTKCQCLAWAIMQNHVHILIRTGEKSLTELMRKILTGYAIYFNRKYKRHGYLYQNRYKSILCQEDVYLKELVRYIHLNPVRAKIIKNIDELDKYKWTGHSAIIGGIKREWQEIDEILILFSDIRKRSIERYKEYIVNGWKTGKRNDLTGGGLKRSAGGWSGIKALKKQKEFWRGDERILGEGNFVNEVLKASEENLERREALLRQGWNLEKVSDKFVSEFSINKRDLIKKGRNNNISIVKNLIAFFCFTDLGINGQELANYFKVSRPAIYKMINKGNEFSFKNNIKL